MKSIIALAILIACSVKSYSQEFKKLRGGILFGVSDGIVASLEPSYRINDQILVGARVEGKIFFGKETGSYGINTQYYFSNKSFRPFAGIGLSLYHTGISGEYSPSSRNEETVLGFYPRIGFDIGQFSLLMDCNIISPAKATIYPGVSSQNQTPYEGHINGNYVSIKAGVVFGGGRKK